MAEKKTVNVYTDDQKIDSETSPINSGEPSLGTPVDAGLVIALLILLFVLFF